MSWEQWLVNEPPEAGSRPLKELLPRVMRTFAPHWKLLTLASIPALGLSVLWLIPPVLTARIIDDAILEGDGRLLLSLSIVMVGVALTIFVAHLASSYLLLLSGERIVRHMTITLFDGLQSQSHRFFVRTEGGVITSRLWSDIDYVKVLIFEIIKNSLGNAVLVVSILVLMFIWNWKLALISISFLPLVFLASHFMGKVNRKYSTAAMIKGEELMSFTVERLSIGGFVLLNGLGYEKAIDSRRFSDGTAEAARLALVRNFSYHASDAISGLLPSLIGASIYLYGGMQVIGQEASLGSLVAFVSLSTMLAYRMTDLGDLYVSLLGSMAVFERFFQWTDLEPEVKDSPYAHDLEQIQGRLSFEDVTFGYEPDEPVIENLTFGIEPGELVALVGPSGAGKTSITYLTLRFYDPTSGSVKLDGRDLRDIRLSSLRKFTSIVPQESVVFHTTVRDNLLIAKPDATDRELEYACEAAQLHSVIENLPDGYRTVVGEMGHRLSGGERQRLAIARALLKQPRILIMDEPTSSLDSITERSIRDALTSMRSGGNRVTTIVIAHRLSTILAADKILVLDEGRCIDSGRHEELLASCELYQRLYEEQFAAQGERALA